MAKNLHNTGGTELVYDGEGHVLAAGESVQVEKTDVRIRALLKSGQLIELKDQNGEKK